MDEVVRWWARFSGERFTNVCVQFPVTVVNSLFSNIISDRQFLAYIEYSYLHFKQTLALSRQRTYYCVDNNLNKYICIYMKQMLQNYWSTLKNISKLLIFKMDHELLAVLKCFIKIPPIVLLIYFSYFPNINVFWPFYFAFIYYRGGWLSCRVTNCSEHPRRGFVGFNSRSR